MPVDSAPLDLAMTRDGNGPPLLLAHGAGGGVALNFTGLIDDLRGERTLIGVDYPGSGLSEARAGSFTLEDLADALVSAGKAAGFDRFPIVGLSLGSAVAVTTALRHPDVVTGLVLTVGFAHADVRLRLVVDVWRYLAAQAPDVLARYLTTVSAPALLDGIADAGEIVAATRAALPAGGPDQAALAAGVDLRDVLADVNVPTLVVVAGRDQIVQPSSTRALADAIAGAEVVEYPDAGHIFTVTEERRWFDDIRAFLTTREL